MWIRHKLFIMKLVVNGVGPHKKNRQTAHAHTCVQVWSHQCSPIEVHGAGWWCQGAAACPDLPDSSRSHFPLQSLPIAAAAASSFSSSSSSTSSYSSLSSSSSSYRTYRNGACATSIRSDINSNCHSLIIPPLTTVIKRKSRFFFVLFVFLKCW